MNFTQFIADNYLLPRHYVSDGIVTAINNLTKKTNVTYKDYNFPSGKTHNGWVVPNKWSVSKAEIRHNGKLIYDGKKHPLGVISYSDGFTGKVTKKQLLKHLFTTQKRPDSIPYHFRLQYRPWDHEWGFCVPHRFKESLADGTYEISLETNFSDGLMITREFTHPGRYQETILFVAHVDHPGLANDDLVGCIIGIQLMNEIAQKYPHSKYTYKLLLTEEIVGSVFYLHTLSASKVKQIKFGLFIEMLGNDNSLHWQESLLGNSYIDIVGQLALKKYAHAKVSQFRGSAGNDEIVFEAPGYEIPMPSISRWPYPEYHTSDDNPTILSEEKMQEALTFLLEVVHILESDAYVERCFEGLVSYANPKYDLYLDPGQIITGDLHKNSQDVNFQYILPRYMNGNYKISELAAKLHLDYLFLYSYLSKMLDKGLIKLNPNNK